MADFKILSVVASILNPNRALNRAARKIRVLEAVLIFAVLAGLSGALFVFGLGSPVSYLLPH